MLREALLSLPRSEFFRHGIDLHEVLFHLAPAVPECIVRIGMECSLEGPHSVLQEHLMESMLDGCRGIVERQQVGEGKGVFLGLGQGAVLVESRHGLDSLSHEVIGFPDHLVTLL